MAEKLEDLNLPNTVVTRLIKEALPEGQNVIVSKEARTALGKAASIFVLYVTSASTDVAKTHNRKTITSQDVLDSLIDMDFESFIEPLQDALDHFKQSQKQKKPSTSVKKKQQKDDAEEEEIESDS